ncbi:hypothetical protein PSCLAVI8L_180052 [Pseudoclavibacter sp. 8L]|nr:hypothetical protein PSCLAVI8L_180052 [Pseudoclavibacter sp. 8L]
MTCAHHGDCQGCHQLGLERRGPRPPTSPAIDSATPERRGWPMPVSRCTCSRDSWARIHENYPDVGRLASAAEQADVFLSPQDRSVRPNEAARPREPSDAPHTVPGY